LLLPEVKFEEVLGERLDEDVGFKPDEMLVWILGDEDGASNEFLTVCSGLDGRASAVSQRLGKSFSSFGVLSWSSKNRLRS